MKRVVFSLNDELVFDKAADEDRGGLARYGQPDGTDVFNQDGDQYPDKREYKAAVEEEGRDVGGPLRGGGVRLEYRLGKGSACGQAKACQPDGKEYEPGEIGHRVSDRIGES